MENVLAAHGVRSACHGETLCACGDGVWRGNSSRAKHIADALALAGFGSQHDAWAEGVATALNHAINNDDGMTLRLEHLDGRPWTNPYPAPKVSES